MPQPRTTNFIPDPALTPALDGERPRCEVYELRGPEGYIIVVTHNLESGETEYDKTTRTALSTISN